MAKVLFVILIAAIFVAACLGQAQYPANVHPASCPNYPFCNVGGYGAPVGYRFDSRLGYPAGIHPAACPNYPYC